MFAIKSKNNKYIVRSEDDVTIHFNLVSQKSAASEFASREEAHTVATEAQRNAALELEFLDTLPPNTAVMLEHESVSEQFLNLSVIAL